MRLVLAPDCFTGTLTAPQAAAAMAEGWLRHAPDDTVVHRPLSDGGPGFIDALAAGGRGTLLSRTVTGPLGDPVPATLLLVAAEADPTGVTSAYLESAQACGLHLVPPQRRDPTRTTTRGVGELLREAVAAGARRVVVGLGGSGTTDGGAGLLAALGVSAAEPHRLAGGPAGFAGLPADPPLTGVPAALTLLAEVDLVVASDVDVPLLGHHGAVRGFAAQKGASPEQVAPLEAALTTFATAVVDALTTAGVPEAGKLVATPGAGAAGGLGFALLALGGRRVSGAEAVVDAVELRAALVGADLVVTGEGSFDWQSLRGKVVSGVSAVAAPLGVPVVVVAGQVAVGRRELAASGIAGAYPVVERPEELERALADPAGTLAARVERVARTWRH